MNQGTTYRQLSYEERIKIATLHERGQSIRSIARILGRSPNTISTELKEKQVKGVYTPRKAQHKTYGRRYRSKRNCMKVALSQELCTLVDEKLPLGWSPERIAGYGTRLGHAVSKKAVYKYVKSRCLEHHLFWRRHRKKGGPKRAVMKTKDAAKRMIEHRPVVTTSGHWELDFIVSRASPVVLLVMVDRWTRYTIIKRLERKTHQGVLGALADIRRHHGMITITTDNDIVFRNWQEVEHALDAPFYFTHPYHSWEKGLVENTNRWIRTFVPKRRDLATVTDDELRSIALFLNETPRQCLGFMTATELYCTVRLVS